MKSGWTAMAVIAVFAAGVASARAEVGAPAVAAFNTYIGQVEARLAGEHAQGSGFLAGEGADQRNATRLKAGETIIEQIVVKDVPEGMLHDWRGTAFVPGGTATDFERLMRDFGAYPGRYAPEVQRAKVTRREGDRYQVSMRVRQKHVITVVLDTDYDVVFRRLDAAHGYSISHSTRIAEIEGAGTDKERELGPGEEHGFLWRQDTYWSYEERDGGLYMQIESVTLTRAIPTGLGWVVRPFVESVPKESVELTLQKTRGALRR